MGEFLKCECSHCGQPIEYASEGTGQTVPCPTCEKLVTLTPANAPTISLIEIPPAPDKVAPAVTQMPKVKKIVRTNLSKLTEETIRARTKAGSTPLHRAAKSGQFDLIPSHLLSVELFMVRNNDGNTPLHVAARQGTLDQVPHKFLTKETLTVRATPHYAPEGFYFTGSGYKALAETVLHIAALYGHGNQIPEEFLTPEFLCIEAKGHAQTVLHYFAMSKSLDLIPKIYANSEIWNLRDSSGQTPRSILEGVVEREAYVARVRIEPATEKQKEKLRYFGYAFDEKISKGQASDAIDECVKQFPQKNADYYNRPATEEQLAKLRSRNKTLTYGQAKDLIWERDMEKRHRDRVSEIEENSYQLVIMEFLRWRVDHYRHLTYSRVKKAARTLDKINPGWSKLGNCQDLLLEKVTELYPELAAKENWL